MEQLITNTKLLHFIEKKISNQLPLLMNDLLQGDLLNFEEVLSKLMSDLYTEISSEMLPSCSKYGQETIIERCSEFPNSEPNCCEF